MMIGIIGLGSIGTRHARNIQTLGHNPILFDTDIDQSRKARAEIDGGVIATYSDIRACLENWAGWIDAVVICTPASTHAAVAQQLLDAGYQGPLFVEKPVALSVEDAEVFTRWPHPTTMVGYMLRFHPGAVNGHAIVGPPVWVDMRMECDMRTWPGASYGPMLSEMSHEIDLALWLGAGALRSAMLTDTHAYLVFERGRVNLNAQASTYFREWFSAGREFAFQASFTKSDELGNEMYVDEIAHFLDCAQRGVPTETPFADGIRVLDVIAQAETMTKVRA